MAEDVIFLIILVYSVMETMEKFGVSRTIAHLLAIPIGIIVSYAFLNSKSIFESVTKGILIGATAVGTCDTNCNIIDFAKRFKKGSS
jgi:hypothetical protein